MERNPIRLAPELVQRSLELGRPIPAHIAHFVGYLNHIVSGPPTDTEVTPASITYHSTGEAPRPPEPMEPTLPAGLRFKDPNHRELGFEIISEQKDVA